MSLPGLSRADLLACLLLVAVVILRWHGITTFFWRADDPALLLHALQSPGLTAFADPTDWRRLSPSNLTPWVTASFKLDLALAGLQPSAFYLHQVVSAAFVAVAAYAVGRYARMSPPWAAAAVLLGLAGAPTAAVTELLMTRHYLEGLLFTLLSLLAFLRAWRHGKTAWAWLGAGFYALACSAKEVYVPLPLVLMCLPRPGGVPSAAAVGVARRAALLLPYLVIAASYVLWRRWMLGDAVGGYGSGSPLLSMASAAAMGRALSQFPADLLGPSWVIALPVACAAGVWALVRRPAWLAFTLVSAACVLLPLWPLALGPGFHGPDRYLYLVWWVAVAGLVAALRSLPWDRLPTPGRPAVAFGAVALLVVAAGLQSVAASGPRQAAMRGFDAVGRYLLAHDERSAFIAPDAVMASYWYVSSLCEIRRLSGGGCPQAVIPGWPLDERVQRLAVYDPASGAMTDATSNLAEARQRVAAFDGTKPLSIELTLDRGMARWRLGPHRDGQYYLVSPALGRYPLAPQGELRTILGEVTFQVQFDARVGWRTASPVLVVRPGQPVVWVRAAEAASNPAR